MKSVHVWNYGEGFPMDTSLNAFKIDSHRTRASDVVRKTLISTLVSLLTTREPRHRTIQSSAQHNADRKSRHTVIQIY